MVLLRIDRKQPSRLKQKHNYLLHVSLFSHHTPAVVFLLAAADVFSAGFHPNPSSDAARLTPCYPTESSARKSPAVQAILLRINAAHPLGPVTASTVEALITRYELEEMPLRYSTRVSYQSFINRYIRPRWAETPISSIRPMAVEDWLRQLVLAPKTRGHIRGLMSQLFKCAQRWELIQTNPTELVRVKDVTKRLARPTVLTAAEFHGLLVHVQEPYRTMVLIAGCLGLRASELVGLQWAGFDFEKATLLIQRGVVHGRVDDVKTEYSRDSVPLAPELAAELLAYRERCYPTPEGWLFANPATGRPYHQDSAQQDYIRQAGKDAGLGDRIGWKTLRHSYRSWMDDTGAPIGVQRELMRHASIQTTMNVYGRAMTDSKRQAHGNVVQMVLKTTDTMAAGDGNPVSTAIVG